jgi:hypothetical protein
MAAAVQSETTTPTCPGEVLSADMERMLAAGAMHSAAGAIETAARNVVGAYTAAEEASKLVAIHAAGYPNFVGLMEVLLKRVHESSAALIREYGALISNVRHRAEMLERGEAEHTPAPAAAAPAASTLSVVSAAAAAAAAAAVDNARPAERALLEVRKDTVAQEHAAATRQLRREEEEKKPKRSRKRGRAPAAAKKRAPRKAAPPAAASAPAVLPPKRPTDRRTDAQRERQVMLEREASARDREELLRWRVPLGCEEDLLCHEELDEALQDLRMSPGVDPKYWELPDLDGLA